MDSSDGSTLKEVLILLDDNNPSDKSGQISDNRSASEAGRRWTLHDLRGMVARPSIRLVAVLLTICGMVALSRQPMQWLRAAPACKGPSFECDFAGRPRQIQTTGGVVSADHGKCSEIGAQVLKDGGHAVDAAVASALCLGVVNPFASGLGGGLFMVIHTTDGNADFIDAREPAPAAATFNMFSGLDPFAALDGGLSIGIPLELKGLESAWQRYGRRPWSSLVAPSAELARSGYPLHPYLQHMLSGPFVFERVKKSPLLREAFLMEDNGTWRIPEVGEWCCKRPTLAATLDRIAKEGSAGLYSPNYAATLAQEVQDAGGIITKNDILSAEPQRTPPLTYKIGDLEFLFPPPPSSAAGVMMALEILSGYLSNNDTVASTNPLLQSHRLVETMKHVFAVRTFMGDPNFCDMTDVLRDVLDQDFADTLRQMIDDHHVLERSQYGDHWNPYRPPWAPGVMPTDHGTSHVSIVDDDGNAVSMTLTINIPFGAGVVSESTGIIFNDEMGDFTLPLEGSSYAGGGQPGEKCGPYEANFIAPGKRPLSSMSPIIVLRNGRVHMVVGGSGGTHIVTAVLQVLVDMLLHRQAPLASIESARLHQQFSPASTEYESFKLGEMEFAASSKLVEYLENKGNTMLPARDQLGATQFIIASKGLYTAVSDPRKDGAPAASADA